MHRAQAKSDFIAAARKEAFTTVKLHTSFYKAVNAPSPLGLLALTYGTSGYPWLSCLTISWVLN